MGSGASFCLVSRCFAYWLSRRPSLETRVFRGFKLRPHRSSPYLAAGKAESHTKLHANIIDVAHFKYHSQYSTLR